MSAATSGNPAFRHSASKTRVNALLAHAGYRSSRARRRSRASDSGATNTARAFPRAPRARPSSAPHWPRPGGGRRRHVAVEPRLLLVVERGVERLQLGLDGVEGRERRGDALLRRLEPRRGRGGNVLRAVGGKPLRRLLGGVAQAVERLALGLVSADGARDRVERPVLELGRLHGATAHELVDGGAERAAAAAGHVSALGGAAAA
jgi:hypothetical protein